jgi:hypothetical protein
MMAAARTSSCSPQASVPMSSKAFDANPSGGQDLLDISGLGITAAPSAASVVIADAVTNVLITIGGDTVTLVNVPAVNRQTSCRLNLWQAASAIRVGLTLRCVL